MEIRPAGAGESVITALGLRSKARWGYDVLRQGARRVGEARSASTGRLLPRLVIATG